MKNRASLTKNTLPVTESVVSASGLVITTARGKRILDFSSQTLNLNLGQRHPVVLKAIREYVAFSPSFLSSRFLNPELQKLADMLVAESPKGLTMVNLKLTNGSDANESAFKRVRTYRKKHYIVSYSFSHLGETSETIAASGSLLPKQYIGGSGNFIFVKPQFLTCKHDMTVSCQRGCLRHIEELFRTRGDIAAIILEPIMVNAGAYAFTPSYLRVLRLLCDQYNISLIFDEVQTAFGWTGDIFYSNRVGVTPDLITLAKSLSAGYPLAAVLMKPEYDVLGYGLDEFTSGGHVMSIKIAIQMLQYIKTRRVLEHVNEISTYLSKNLKTLQKRYPRILLSTRVFGLIAGIEFANNQWAKEIYNLCLVKGLMVRQCKDGLGESLVLKPAIVVSKKEIDMATSILGTVLGKLADYQTS